MPYNIVIKLIHHTDRKEYAQICAVQYYVN